MDLTIANRDNSRILLYFSLVSFVIYVFILGIVILVKPGLFFYFSFLFPVIPVLFYVLINKLEFSFLLYIVFLPFVQHLSVNSIPIGDFRVTPDILIHFLLMIAFINQFLYTYRKSKNDGLTLQDKLIILFVLFSFFSLISASALPINHSKRLLLYYTGIFQTVSFYFAILYFLKRIPCFTKQLLIALSLTSFSAGIIALYELNMVGFSLISIFLARTEIGFGYHNTNLFGMHAALLFPVLIYMLSESDFKNYKILVWCSFITLSILSLLTLNRGTFVVLAFNLFVLFWKKENRKMVIGFLVFGIVGAIYYSDLLVLYFNRFFTNSGGNERFLTDESALYRIEVWRVAIKAILNYPLGLGGTGYMLAWAIYTNYPHVIFVTPHQIFLYIAVDYGLPALFIFLTLIIIVLRKLSILYKSVTLRNRKLFFYIKLSLIGYIIHGFLTGGELSHLSGTMYPNNGYTYILMILLAFISFETLRNKI